MKLETIERRYKGKSYEMLDELSDLLEKYSVVVTEYQKIMLPEALNEAERLIQEGYLVILERQWDKSITVKGIFDK